MKKYEEYRNCRYCERSNEVMDDDNVLCDKKGIVARDYVCGGFRLDLMKLDPAGRTVPVGEVSFGEDVSDL
ncbi:MAG: hypothetical protein IJV00_02960 [Clostridia bacterium]|nr:hypothetical protein [Clostridia bacterium]